MKNQFVLKELYIEMLETCAVYGMKVEPGMTYFDVWHKILEKLGTPLINELVDRFESSPVTDEIERKHLTSLYERKSVEHGA